MPAYLEVWTQAGSRLFNLEGSRVGIGRAPECDLQIIGDETISRLHALLEKVGDQWTVQDLQSSNGTHVNKQKIWSATALHAGDEIRIGEARLIFRSDVSSTDLSLTRRQVDAPRLTSRERDILIALCRPLLVGGAFREPASAREIAEKLVVTEDAVKKHLSRLYDKFGISEDQGRRRSILANLAVSSGAISIADLRAPTDDTVS